jgi:hypothetical protein
MRPMKRGELFVATGTALVSLFLALPAGADALPDDRASVLRRADTAQAAGRLDEAAQLFGRARQASPGDPLPVRGACEVALTLEEAGRRNGPSREPCHSAFRLTGQPQDMRNEVASLLSPGSHPSLDDLVVAGLIADAAVRKATDQPWGYLARCDIARRLGSADVLESCLADLRRVAPAHLATMRAQSYAAEHAPLGARILRILLSLGLLGTLAHAVLRRRRPAARRPPVPAQLAAALMVGVISLAGFGTGVVRAEPVPSGDRLSQFKIDDADPEAGVPAAEVQDKMPLEFGYYLQDLAAKAERAAKAGDHAAEARYYRALTKAAPTSAYGARKLCEALEATGDIPSAITACRTTITREGSTAGDYIHFVNVVLSSRGPLPPLEQKELQAVIAHLAGEAQLGALPTMLRCEVALRFDDTAALESCTMELGRTAPNDPKTVSFQWALALAKNDRRAALRLVDRARGVGMSSDGIAKMEQATRIMYRRRLARFALLALAAGLLAALSTIGFRHLAQRRRLAV